MWVERAQRLHGLAYGVHGSKDIWNQSCPFSDINVVHTLGGGSALRVMTPVGVKRRKGSRVPCEVHRSKALR